MVFSEPVFLFVFLPVAMAIILLAIRTGNGRWHAPAILLASTVFYYWSSGLFVVALLACVFANWWTALRIARDHRRRWLVLGLLANLGTLGFFKYSYFVTNNFDLLFGTEASPRLADLILPVGISFFSFQGVSYLMDVWRGDTSAERDPLLFGAYLTFFPQLIAGPIVRYRDVIANYRAPAPNLEAAAYGARRFAHGLFKKVVIADTVAPIADACFALDPTGLSFAAAWIGVAAYAIQIYFDFSGYSDMAIGLASLCGISLRENFDRPYASATITEFWRRWHVSLSSWFRDYLYVPLGGNRGSSASLYRNLLIVFAATGFWHGAAWTFLAWGAYHGLFLIFERVVFSRDRLARAGLALRFFYMLPVTMTGWVLFRAEDLPSALAYARSMWLPFASANPAGVLLPDLVLSALTPMTLLVFLGSALCFAMPRERTAAHLLRPDATFAGETLRNVYLLAGLSLCGVLVLTRDFSPFLYFRF